MNIQQIVNRVLELGLDETDAENGLEERVLNDVFAVYCDLLQSAADSDENQLVSETLILSNGAGTLTQRPLYIATVKDMSNGGRILAKTDLTTLENQYWEMNDTGSPGYYYVSNYQQVNAYPSNNTTLRVRYYPAPVPFTLETTESEIKIPREFHEALVTGAVYYTKLREQGFHNDLDRREALNFYTSWKSNYLSAMEALTKADRHVKYYDF